jgi:hypothetical protein
VASTVIAVVALVVSVASTVFTGWQAVETRRVRQIEVARRHEKRTPTFRTEVEAINDGQWHRLWIVLTSAGALDSLAVTILDPMLVWFPPARPGSSRDQTANKAHGGRLSRACATFAFRIEWEDEDSHLARIALRSKRRRNVGRPGTGRTSSEAVRRTRLDRMTRSAPRSPNSADRCQSVGTWLSSLGADPSKSRHLSQAV